MTSTEILPFCTDTAGGGGNRLTPAAYAALTALLAAGFQAGVAQSDVVNTVLAQASFMSAGLASWIVTQGISVPDDGDLAALVSEIDDALNAKILATAGGGGGTGNVVGPGSAHNGYFVIFDGTTGKLIKDGAGAPGSAAYLTAGTAANNVVQLDGSAHLPAINGAALTSLNGSNIGSGTVTAARLGSGTTDSTTILYGDNVWRTSSLPTNTTSKLVLGALTIQWGSIALPASVGAVTVTYGTAFSSAPYAVFIAPSAAGAGTGSGFNANVNAHNWTSTTFQIDKPGSGTLPTTATWIAIGPT